MDSIKFSFELNGKLYTAPIGWHDVKFSKFLAYLDDVSPLMPKCLVDFHGSENPQNSYESLNNKELSKCYEFYAKYVSFWFGRSEERR